ncbi:MAG: DnaA ATPase domain-containing protein, partial [Gemmatimonadota bacterium]
MELTATEAWTSITTAARKVLPEQTIRTWLTSTEPVTLSDDTLVVAAPTRFAVEWIEDKYGDLLRQLARRELGQEMLLRFEHHGLSGRVEFPDLKGDAIDIAVASPSEEHVVEVVEAPAREGAALADPTRAVGLNGRYTFERFVIGNNSQLAAAACRGVADSPAKVYNPLFIYGDTGLGKTHLMHAVGNEILGRDPGVQVAYVTSEQFTNEMIAAIQGGQTSEF